MSNANIPVQRIVSRGATGEIVPVDAYPITVPFGEHEIELLVDKENRFLAVLSIRLRKDFRSVSQSISSTGVHNVEEFYKD